MAMSGARWMVCPCHFTASESDIALTPGMRWPVTTQSTGARDESAARAALRVSGVLEHAAASAMLTMNATFARMALLAAPCLKRAQWPHRGQFAMGMIRL